MLLSNCMATWDKKARFNQASREWKKRNPAKVKAAWRNWKAKNPNYKRPRTQDLKKKRAATIAWRAANKEHIKTYNRAWYEKNKASVATSQKRRYRENPGYRIEMALRNRIRETIRSAKGVQSSRFRTSVGCSVEFLRGFIEARFKPGMRWANYGSVWEIDHIVPCASFDLTDVSHQKSCFHYSNLQPLWSHENRAKGARAPAVHQAELL